MSRKAPNSQIAKMREKGYYTIKQAAELAKVNMWTLYRWVRAGKVESQTVAYNNYVSLDSLARFIGPFACEAAGLEYPKDEDDTRHDQFLE